jgi:outer membrane protein assembly factor BamB
MRRRSLGIILAVTIGLIDVRAGRAADLIDRQLLDQVDLQLYWQAQAPLAANDLVRRIVALEDNLYILTEQNRVFAIHAPTGVIRWSREVAEPGQTVRGPTHSKTDAVFTTTTSVRLFNRRTGSLAGEPRRIRGYIIEVRGDLCDVNVGELHGVSTGDVLNVFRGDTADAGVAPIARIKMTRVGDREGTGRFLEAQQRDPPRAGDRVAADIRLPIVALDVPYSPSSAAVSDGANVYFGAANQRFYALSIRYGYRVWELLTPRTVTAQPVLSGDDLYIAGRDGTINKIAAQERTRAWPAAFRTEGPIFARPTVTAERVYVASSDRSVYALDARTGRRRWRERFDAELLDAPVASGELVYQHVPRSGVVALSADDGSERWRAKGGLAMLAQVGEFAFVLAGVREEGREATTAAALMRYDAKTGEPRGVVDLPNIPFAAGTLRPAAIFVVDPLGRVLCARSATEPHLKPAELAEAMRDEAAAAAIADVEKRMAAERKAKQAARRPPVDPFASRSTTPPAAGPGLVPPTEPGKPAAPKPETEPAEGEAPAEGAEERPAPEEGEMEEKPAAEEEKAGGEEEGEGEPAEEGGEKTDEEKPPEDEKPADDDGA